MFSEVYFLHIFLLAVTMCYELNEDLKSVSHYYLASDEEVAPAQAKVLAQGKAERKKRALV